MRDAEVLHVEAVRDEMLSECLLSRVGCQFDVTGAKIQRAVQPRIPKGTWIMGKVL